MFEWTMRGAQSLENKGFHLSAAKDTVFGAQMNKDVPVSTVCLMCHSPPGILSVNTRTGLFHEGKMARPAEFQPAAREKLDEVTMEAARKAADWARLRAEWEK